MLDVFSLIFVADIKIIFCYDFAAPLKKLIYLFLPLSRKGFR